MDETGIEYRINKQCEQEDFYFVLAYNYTDYDMSEDKNKRIYLPTKNKLIKATIEKIQNKDVLLDYYTRVIGTNIRYGINSLIIDNKIRYFAFYGTPNRNDDYFTTVEISESEFYDIENKFDCCTKFDFCETDNYAKKFEELYINDRPVILEGNHKLLDRYYLKGLSKENTQKIFANLKEYK